MRILAAFVAFAAGLTFYLILFKEIRLPGKIYIAWFGAEPALARPLYISPVYLWWYDLGPASVYCIDKNWRDR